MKLQQLTAAPPDLWAVFAEMEKGPDDALRPASAVESVQRVVCLALPDDQRDTDEAVDVVTVLIDDEHGQFWLADEAHSFVSDQGRGACRIRRRDGAGRARPHE